MKTKIKNILSQIEKGVFRNNKNFIIMLLGFFIIVIFASHNNEVKASEGDLIGDKLMPWTKVIGCYNDYSMDVRYATKCTKPGDKNILVPARAQLDDWRAVGYSDKQIVNRFSLITFESQFDINASNPSAKGYVQTLRSYNIPIDIITQLEWMKNREEKTYAKKFYAGKYGKTRGCGYYWDKYNKTDGVDAGESGVMACFYRYHYDANKGQAYAKRAMKARELYLDYFFNIKNG